MFVSCGDALFDFFARPAAATGAIDLEGRVGGSPLNVAVGLARLGNAAGFLAKNSTDVFGRSIADYLAENGVSTDFLIGSSRNSTLAVVNTGSDGSADYAFYTSGTADRSMRRDELPDDLGDGVACVHVASYSTVTEPTASALATLVARETEQRFISYDPNIRANIEPDLDRWRAQVELFSRSAHCVKASDEDLRLLYPGAAPDVFAADCIARGASLVFITRGPDGALGFSATGDEAQAAGVSVDVVDTVGAGDTFQAATLHWLATEGLIEKEAAKNADLQALMTFAIGAAAITCTRRGADLPRLADVEGAHRTTRS